jgi:catechol 2,3-dioxygenase-like lactoylglutathione lyase family enzyme
MLHWLILAAMASPATQPVAAPSPAALIDHVALEVADPGISADFYERILGLRPFPQKVSPTMRWLGSDNFQLHLMGGRKKPVDGATDTHFAFRVANLADVLHILDQNHVAWVDSDGVPRKITTRVDGVLQVYFQDPDGYWIEVNQAPK